MDCDVDVGVRGDVMLMIMLGVRCWMCGVVCDDVICALMKVVVRCICEVCAVICECDMCMYV